MKKIIPCLIAALLILSSCQAIAVKTESPIERSIAYIEEGNYKDAYQNIEEQGSADDQEVIELIIARFYIQSASEGAVAMGDLSNSMTTIVNTATQNLLAGQKVSFTETEKDTFEQEIEDIRTRLETHQDTFSTDFLPDDFDSFNDRYLDAMSKSILICDGLIDALEQLDESTMQTKMAWVDTWEDDFTYLSVEATKLDSKYRQENVPEEYQYLFSDQDS